MSERHAFETFSSEQNVSYSEEVLSVAGTFPHWFAVYVKSRYEKQVTLSLGNKGYEAFLPTYVKTHTNRKTFDLPLFPGYVFCRFEALSPLPILTTPGVVSIVSNGCVPLPIPEHEIEAVRRLSGAQLGPRPWPYSPGETVHIHAGPLSGIDGVVVQDSHETWLVISIHLLQRSVAVKIERSCIYAPDVWLAADSPCLNVIP